MYHTQGGGRTVHKSLRHGYVLKTAHVYPDLKCLPCTICLFSFGFGFTGCLYRDISWRSSLEISIN